MSEINPERCKELVPGVGGWHRNQCSRKPWKDGYCKQHHPDSVKKRQEKAERLYQEKRAKSPWVLLGKANEKIKRLEAKIKRLENADAHHRISNPTRTAQGQA